VTLQVTGRWITTTRDDVVVSEFDQLAELYDETRGGEERGDDYAATVAEHLPAGDAPILEIGVGTGVVALGLQRRGRKVIGLDLSAPMLSRGRTRLGPTVVRSDALQMAIATESVAHAVSVWVVQSVADPLQLFREAARVIRPNGRYVVCGTQHPAPDDEIGQLIEEMGRQVDVRRGASRPRAVAIDEILNWAGQAGFAGTVHQSERQWVSSPGEELRAIALRAWPALRELDEASIEDVTRPVVDALRAMPQTDVVRRGTGEMAVLERERQRP
jgi:ubiquinone/menaquinone biosynthesis C-methylase UbiE